MTAAVARVFGVDCTACHTARRDGSLTQSAATWSMSRSRNFSQSRDGISCANCSSSCRTATASTRSSSQTMTYLFWKNW